MVYPAKYNEELADEICAAIATGTESIFKLCPKFAHWPSPTIIYQWKLKHKGFADRYAEAKRHQAELLAESVIEVANDKAYYTDADGNKRIDPGHIASQRLIADTRKWIACKLLPKVYGDKQTIDQNITINHEDALKELE